LKYVNKVLPKLTPVGFVLDSIMIFIGGLLLFLAAFLDSLGLYDLAESVFGLSFGLISAGFYVIIVY